MATIRVSFAPEFCHVVDAAMMRFGYLYPDIQLQRLASDIVLSADDAVDLRDAAKQLRYTLYREAIAERSREVRTLVAKSLFG